MKYPHLLISSFFVFALAACGSDGPSDEPKGSHSIAAWPSSFEFTAAGGDASFEVTATKEWDAVPQSDWVTVTKSGTLDTRGTVNLTVKENSSYSERSTTVTLMCGSARASVNIAQAAREVKPVDPTISVPEGYAMVWNDEFDSGTTLNSDWWTHQTASSGWVNNELQNYVNGSYDGTRVTEIKDGHLSITAFKAGGKVYSGRVYAMERQGWKYGIFEAAIRLPKGRGTWPAFWMMPANNDWASSPWPKCGEIDIMEEVGYRPNYTSSSIHCESYNHTKGTQKTAERYTSGAEDEYHIYRLEWTEDYIRTYVDGNMLLSFANDKAGNVNTWPFNKPFYIILNLAWGGDWGGAQGVDESALPATMDVEYVRVFQKI